MSTGSDAFFPFSMPWRSQIYTAFVLFSGFTPIKTIFLKIWGKTTAQEYKTFISGLRSSLRNVFTELLIAFTTRFSYGLISYEPL